MKVITINLTEPWFSRERYRFPVWGDDDYPGRGHRGRRLPGTKKWLPSLVEISPFQMRRVGQEVDQQALWQTKIQVAVTPNVKPGRCWWQSVMSVHAMIFESTKTIDLHMRWIVWK